MLGNCYYSKGCPNKIDCIRKLVFSTPSTSDYLTFRMYQTAAITIRRQLQNTGCRKALALILMVLKRHVSYNSFFYHSSEIAFVEVRNSKENIFGIKTVQATRIKDKAIHTLVYRSKKGKV